MYKKHFFLLLSVDAKKITYKYYTNERTGRKKQRRQKKEGGKWYMYICICGKEAEKRERKNYQPFSAFFSLRYSMILSPVNSSRTCTM